MKNLSEFKKVLTSCITHNLCLRSKITNKHGEVIKENDFAPVKHIQSNSFALERNGQLSWVEFGKASQWEFKNSFAYYNFPNGGQAIFELQNPEFFGL
jgi:hypothetical protein